MPLFHRFAVYSLAGCISLLTLLVLPALVGVLTDTSALTEIQAGWAASAGFVGSALIALLMAFRMHHVDLRLVAVGSFLVAAAGDVLSAFLTGHPLLFIVCRFLTGIGGGAAYTALVAAFARERHAERGYGLFITLQFIVSGIGLYLLPVFSDRIDARGLYLVFALLDVVGAWLCTWMPRRGDESVRIEGALGRAELQVLLTRATLFGVLGFAIFEAANTAQFTYVERFAIALSFSDQQIGLAMLVGSLAGIPGAFAIVLTGSRFGYVGPIALGVAASVLGLWLLISNEAYSAFFVAFCLLGFGWAFCLPYIQGLLASLDRAGSALAAGAASSTLGGAAGPALAATLLGNMQYRRVFVAAAIGLLLAVITFRLARADKEKR